jgi:hypothetical protein
LLPGPDVADGDLDLGLMEPDPEPAPQHWEDPRTFVGGIDAPGDDEELPPYPEPARLKAKPGSSQGKPRSSGAKVRVTAATAKDINAKVRIALEVPGRVWQARDEFCGGVFVHQAPEIADALTEIILDSPDLIAWFTGPAGGFMKYFKLLMALQPVGVTVYAHHVSHAIQAEQAGAKVDPARYAA